MDETSASEIRALDDERDSLEALTELLHAAYAELKTLGFRYKAVDQSVDVTRDRIARGECYVALQNGVLVGTAMLNLPGRHYPGSDWYQRPDVAVLSQFAVEPRLQRRGWGSKLILHLEARARELGDAELAIDTAEGATHLIALYERRGYRHVGFAQWPHTNYRSVVLSKRLGD